MRKVLALGLVLLAATPVWAKKGKPDKTQKDDDSDSSDDDSSADDDSADDKPQKKDKAKAKDDDSDSDDSSDDSGDDDDTSDSDDKSNKPDKSDKADKADAAKADDEPKKQDLTGHDLGTKKKTTEFEKDRFYVDKIDTPKTENSTLIQGSLALSSFYYSEGGGKYPTPGNLTGGDTGADRLFTDLRLQTDFRHIGGGRWDARIDGRVRFVNTPDADAQGTVPGITEPNHVQSGFNGQNEYDLRELWLVRNGERSDVFIGRQYIPDLGAVKIDGLRIDYAQSNKLTLIGFGGLYPIRGSRSLTTDYVALKVPGNLDPAGKYVGAVGGGGAYRTVNAYGSLGGVALVPFEKEQARIYLTSSGYYRAGSKLDFYHFALVDVVGTAGAQLTNLSAGINGKPTDRLRLTASVNHVDTETLSVQAGAFLNAVDQQPGGLTVVQNETFIRRLATNEARGGVSAGLGEFQRFQVSTAISYLQRPAFTLQTGNKTTVNIDDAASIEVWGSIVDRHSIKDARIGIEGAQTFGIGTLPYQRNQSLYLRGYIGHEVKNGRGEFIIDVSSLNITDAQKSADPACAAVNTCYGASTSTIYQLDGELYYRLNADWYGVGSLSLSRNTTKAVAATAADPPITGLTGFLRIAYRF